MLITCKTCGNIKDLEDFPKDKSKKLGIRSSCKSCRTIYDNSRKSTIKLNKARFNSNNPEKASQYKKKHFQKAKPNIMAYKRYRRANDPMYRLKENLRCRVRMALNKRQWPKDSNTHDLLGADYDTVYSHIQALFIDGMSWDQVGKLIHIDHIIPLASANTEEELIKLFHYINLQPLWAIDNLRKGDKIQ